MHKIKVGFVKQKLCPGYQDFTVSDESSLQWAYGTNNTYFVLEHLQN